MEIDNLVAAANLVKVRQILQRTSSVKDYESFIKKLNATILKSLNPMAGQYRTEDKIISNCPYTPPNPDRIPSLMQVFTNELAYELKSFGNEFNNNGILLAAEAHCKLARIQPFDDGNKRTARALADIVLKQTVGKQIDYQNFDMSDYIQRTLIYYTTQDIKPFYDFLKSNVLHTEKEITIKSIDDINEEQRLFAKAMEQEQEPFADPFDDIQP